MPSENTIYPEMEVVGCSEKTISVYQFLNDSNDSANRFVLDIATFKEGLVCSDPAPKIAEAHEMGLISIFSHRPLPLPQAVYPSCRPRATTPPSLWMTCAAFKVD